jgi:hypothetical protein
LLAIPTLFAMAERTHEAHLASFLSKAKVSQGGGGGDAVRKGGGMEVAEAIAIEQLQEQQRLAARKSLHMKLAQKKVDRYTGLCDEIGQLKRLEPSWRALLDGGAQAHYKAAATAVPASPDVVHYSRMGVKLQWYSVFADHTKLDELQRLRIICSIKMAPAAGKKKPPAGAGAGGGGGGGVGGGAARMRSMVVAVPLDIANVSKLPLSLPPAAAGQGHASVGADDGTVGGKSPVRLHTVPMCTALVAGDGVGGHDATAVPGSMVVGVWPETGTVAFVWCMLHGARWLTPPPSSHHNPGSPFLPAARVALVAPCGVRPAGTSCH